MSDMSSPTDEAVAKAAALDADAKKLIDRGEHTAAALAYLHGRRFSEAAKIFEDIFEFERAYDVYREGDDVRGMLRVALAQQDEALVDAAILRATTIGATVSLVPLLERQGRYVELGKILLAEGEYQNAAQAFERAGALARAGLCREQLAQFREAGVLYERHLEQSPNDPDVCHRLGRILARFSRHDSAIVLFQNAIRHAADENEMIRKVAPWMVLSFLAQNYLYAAEAAFERFTASAPEGATVPPSLRDFLRSDEIRAALLSQRTEEGSALLSSDLAAFVEGARGPLPESGDAELGDGVAGADGGMLLSGRYLLGEPLGGGGVGQVFRAFDSLLDKSVAVKIFGSAAMASQAVQRYAIEARAAAGLNHPSVVKLVELNMDQGYVVTELVETQSFETRLREGGDSGWLAAATGALLDMLAASHRIGLVHGALKPTNIFVAPGGVRVVDFGAHHLLALRSTETGGLASIWPYLAPEQLFGAPPDAAADLYAVCAMIYRALAGVPPFSDALADRKSAPRPLAEIRDDVPAEWSDFIQQALAVERSDRFHDVEAMRAQMPKLETLPQLREAHSMDRQTTDADLLLADSKRYQREALIFRHGEISVYEGRDTALERPVWLLRAGEHGDLSAFAALAQVSRGLQPVYDVLGDSDEAVLARSEKEPVPLDTLLRVPQGLFRDLVACAQALQTIHGLGWVLGDIDVGRLRAPEGARLKLVPYPPPQPASEAAIQLDWDGFAAAMFSLLELEVPTDGPSHESFLDGLRHRGVLERGGYDALIGPHASWPDLLERVVDVLVKRRRMRIGERLSARLDALVAPRDGPQQ